MMNYLLLFALLLAGCDVQSREARYLKRGDAQFARGQYEKARLDYLNALRIKPVDPEIHYRLGLVEEQEQNIGAAYGEFRQSAEQDPHFQPALLKIASYDLAGGQLEQAQQQITTVLAAAPGQPEGLALQGALLLRQKDFAGAAKDARQALATDPANITAFSVLSGTYLAVGQPQQAAATVEAGIAKNPGALPLLLLKAGIDEQAGNLVGVDAAYQAIFKLQPAGIQYRLDLAALYIKAGELDRAEATLRAAIAARPDDWTLKHALVQFLSEHRSLAAAESAIELYLKASPAHDDLYAWLADLYISHDAIDKAVALLQQIAERNGSAAPGLNARAELARIDFVRGNRAVAEKLVAAVLAKDPDNRPALLVRANLAYDQGYYEDTVADLRTILSSQAKDPEALQLLAETLLRQGHLDLASDTLADLIEAAPGDLGARVRLAQLHQAAGDHQAALAQLDEVTKADPAYAVAWETEARLALDDNNLALADTAIQTLAKLPGQQPTAAFLQGQLAAKKGENQSAIAAYTGIVAADPTSPLADHSLAALVQEKTAKGDLAGAAAYLATVQDKNPYAQTLLGETDVKLGRTTAAATALDAVIAKNPRDAQPYLDRAKLYREAQQPEAALAMLQQASAAVPGDLRAPLLEADILGQQGKTKPAMALYEEILQHHPGLEIAANNLASLIADDAAAEPADLEKAAALAQPFEASTNPALLDTLAWVDYRRGNPGAATAAMARVAGTPANMTPEMHYHYGAILLKNGQVEAARAELQKAVGGGDYPGLDAAKQLLAGIP
jgi:tetratricopeptide (TPR) repeat protein